jgi:alkylated DNA repair dioxygenase AlkB
MLDQGDLFGAAPRMPEGFAYQPELISKAEERELIERIRGLPFKEFQFQGFVGKRRVVSFGWRYDFNERVLLEERQIPDFLLPVRAAVATFAALEPGDLRQILVTEYDRASIGWHRDKDVFGDVIGLSLLSACTFRLRRKVGATWQRVSLTAEPRSVYLMRGPSRTEWEHSIPETESVRYSITFRTVR